MRKTLVVHEDKLNAMLRTRGERTRGSVKNYVGSIWPAIRRESTERQMTIWETLFILVIRGGDLAASSSDELSDPLITQVVSENETKSDDGDSNSNDDVVPSSHPPEASTSIQVPATAPTLTVQSSMRSKKHKSKYESQHTHGISRQ
jgi:hypothetical protein